MTNARPSFWRRTPAVWPLAGLVVLLLINFATGHNFFNFKEINGTHAAPIVDVFSEGSYCLMLSLGMTLVIATGGIDLSVGSVMALSGAVAGVMIAHGVTSLPLILAASLGAALLCGLVNGVLVSWLRIQPIVATLILMVAVRGVAQVVTGGESVDISNMHRQFDFLGKGFIFGLPFAPILATALFLAASLALRRTATGLFLEAAGDNETASRFAGVATGRIKCAAYVVCGICAGVAGLLHASNNSLANPLYDGQTMELDAIFAVVVGGTALSGGRFTLLGSYVGALMLQTLTATMYYIGVKPAIAPVPKALLIITVCLAQSETTRRWFASLRRKGRAA
jgi:simple sugar transport system permease protein